MRITLLLLCAALLHAQPRKSEELGAIGGTVSNQITGATVRKAAVVFVGTDADHPATYTAITDPLGHFEAREMEPGEYIVLAESNGFDRLRSGPVVVTGGKKNTVDLKLQPLGVITGRVLDAGNEPMANVSVATLRISYRNGHKGFAVAIVATTNDLGQFRIAGLHPGRYYLRAKPLRELGVGADRSEHPPKIGYVVEYYPGTTDPQGAAPIEIAPGSAVEGLTLKLARVPVTRVRGRVTNPLGYTGHALSVHLVADTHFTNYETAVRANLDGTFELAGVKPGSYILGASLGTDEAEYRAWRMVQLGDEPLDNVALNLSPGFTVAGSLRLDGKGTLDFRRLLVVLQPSALPLADNSDCQPGEDGRFTLNHISPDHYLVDVLGLPKEYFVKSIQMRGKEVLEDGADLSNGAAAPLEIVVSPNAGTLSGTVRNEDNKTVPDAMVVLVPDSAKRREHPRWYKTILAGKDGKFLMTGITPGDYKLFAWTKVEDSAWMDGEFLRPIEGKGTKLTVAESGAASLDILVVRE